MKFISKNELKINQTLFNFINEEVLPGTNIKQDDFWNKFAKVVHELVRRRRVVVVPEQYTTKRCSHCRCQTADTIPGKRKEWIPTCTGKWYRKAIHGLRHCIQCKRPLNRDGNASRNIFHMFQSYMTTGASAEYLRRNCDIASPNTPPKKRKHRFANKSPVK